MTEGWAKLGSATQRTSQILGIGIDNLMSWQNLGTMFGVSADQMTQSIQGFSDTLQDAKWGRNQAAFGMLQTLGIGLKQTKDGVIDTESMLVKFADKIRAIQKRSGGCATSGAKFWHRKHNAGINAGWYCFATISGRSEATAR